MTANAVVRGKMKTMLLITVGVVTNIGIAIALDDGLIVPVLHQADQRTFSEIHAQSGDLTARAGTGSVLPVGRWCSSGVSGCTGLRPDP